MIVTGSNIPTAEETGPNSVDTYRPADLEKLGVRNATDLLTMLPQSQHIQPLRRQRGTHVGFDLGDIHRVDHAIGVHVFAEIRATDRIAHLRLGQGDIGSIDYGVAIHITD